MRKDLKKESKYKALNVPKHSLPLNKTVTCKIKCWIFHVYYLNIIFKIFNSLSKKIMSRSTSCNSSNCLALKDERIAGSKNDNKTRCIMSRKLNPGMFQSRTVTGETSANSNALLHQSSSTGMISMASDEVEVLLP